MARLKPVADQSVVVMGASSGIGREAARRFAAAGAGVVASARTASALASLADEITAAGGQVVTGPAEVTDFHQVRAVADAAVAAWGRLDRNYPRLPTPLTLSAGMPWWYRRAGAR